MGMVSSCGNARLLGQQNLLCHRLTEGLELGSQQFGIIILRERGFFMRFGKYESSDNSNIGTAITFLLIGLGAGALAGLLLAPKTGKQMRRDLQKGFEDAKDKVGDWADDAKDRVREAGDRVRDVASRGVDLAADLNNDLREKVEPLRRAINRS